MIKEFISDEVGAYIKDITPEMAERILEEHNILNRTIRTKEVKHYENEMMHGEWIFDGTPIRFLKDGTLADGQHRLTSIKKSGIAQKCLIVVGLTEEARLVIDTGSKRTTGDNLRMAGGFRYNNTILAGINYACGGYSKSYTLSAIETQKFIDKYINQIDAIADFFNTAKKGLSKGAVVAACLLALIAGENEAEVQGFLDVLIYGKYRDTTSGDISAMRLRERLIASTQTSGGTTVKDDIKLVERVFEAYKEDVELSKLYIPKNFTYEIIEPESLYTDEEGENK